MHPSALNSARKIVLNALYPPRCAGCKTFSESLFCPGCQESLSALNPPWCRLCGTPSDPEALAADHCANCQENRYHHAPPFQAARSALYFAGALRTAVHALKYQGKTSRTAELAALMHRALRGDKTLETWPPHFVTPVPLHPWRRWRRGYNQSELLAGALGRELGLPLHNVLRRCRYAPPQVRLNKSERAQNVRGVFAVNLRQMPPRGLNGARVLLVDDVFTTGATVAECAQTLRNAGCRAVIVVTLAREA